MGEYKHYHPGMELFILTTLSLTMFLAIELFSRIQDLYRTFPIIDVVTHFLAGIALAYLAYWIATLLHDKYKSYLAFGFVFVMSVIWELIEIAEEMLVVNPPHLRDVFFWDGFFDIIVALLGAAFALLYLKTLRIAVREALQNP